MFLLEKIVGAPGLFLKYKILSVHIGFNA